MDKRFLGKISLFAFIFTATPVLLPESSNSFFCFPVAWANDRHFGNNGSHGENGKKGQNGENREIFVDGSPLNLDLSGSNGEDGSDGEDGYSNCFNQPINGEVIYNLKAAHGGSGGNGGDGGDGGDGGILTVYYNNIEDLRQIYIRAEGGRGGKPGRSGHGAAGCPCVLPRWETKCTGNPGDPGYSCRTETRDCLDGSDGADGQSGERGEQGKLGKLVLVKGEQKLLPDQPKAHVFLAELEGQTFSLSKNVLQTHQGAKAIVAPGSVINDEYGEFVERIEEDIQLVWQASRPVTDFSNQNITLTLQGKNQIDIASPKEVWLASEISQSNGITQLNITEAILPQEATQLTKANFTGNRSSLTLKLIDRARKSDVLATQFHIKYRTSRNDNGPRPDSTFDYTTRYEGPIPDELVKLEGQGFTLDIGKLPIDSKHLKPGVNVDIEITATRSLGGRSAQKTISWKGKIR